MGGLSMSMLYLALSGRVAEGSVGLKRISMTCVELEVFSRSQLFLK
jgi:hypothetical protein